MHQLYLGRPHGGKLNFTLVTELPFNVLQLTLDPRNVTLRPEYYPDVDPEKYAEVKPLIWFWQMFDRSPVGLNVWLGSRFRCMLGHHVFKHLGKHVRIFRGVEFTFGYNLTIEDNCTIHKFSVLDDRQPLVVRWHQDYGLLAVRLKRARGRPGCESRRIKRRRSQRRRDA